MAQTTPATSFGPVFIAAAHPNLPRCVATAAPAAPIAAAPAAAPSAS